MNTPSFQPATMPLLTKGHFVADVVGIIAALTLFWEIVTVKSC
jgi:hypothetical protein